MKQTIKTREFTDGDCSAERRICLFSTEISNEPLPGVLGNTGTVAFIFREQGIFSNYFQGTGELLTRLLGSFLGTRGFSNGEQGIKSKKVKGSWEHAPPPGRGSATFRLLAYDKKTVKTKEQRRRSAFICTVLNLMSRPCRTIFDY